MEKEEGDMNRQNIEDIRKLSLKEPIVNSALKRYYSGDCTYEDALVIMVTSLYHTKERYFNICLEYERLRQHGPVFQYIKSS